jgi:uncharacterized membrane protein YeaQ/YmgE (transglycosylase-associated protein family)
MAFLLWILIGLGAGWLATELLDGRHRRSGNLMTGLGGGFAGGIVFTNYHGAVELGFFGSLAAAAVGAIVFLAIRGAMRRA